MRATGTGEPLAGRSQLAGEMYVGHCVCVPVFDDLDRSDASPAGHAESHAEFLNRVHTPYWAAVRCLVEGWFTHLPRGAQADVRERLRSDDDRQFHAAFWELYLHESLVRAGYEVTCHPKLEGTSRRPDFLVEFGNDAFYLEARAVSQSDDQIRADRRRNRVYDALNRLNSPNFFLWVDVEGEGSSDLRSKGLRGELEQWLSLLDPALIRAQLAEAKSIRSVAPFEWKANGWYLVFRPWPKGPKSLGNDEIRPLAVFGPGRMNMIDDVTPLRKALDDKGNAYGRLELPYVVAIRTASMSTDAFDVLNALYGSEQVRVRIGPDNETISWPVRAPDGYWYGGTEWRHRHVSAVLVAQHLAPWNVAANVPTLWEHPDAERAVVAPPMWRRAIATDEEIEYVDAGVVTRELFGLPPDWPGADPFESYPIA